ncbi:hypothetical protein AGMMS4956_14400 [Bacteroidia bacterium]|nr:hypothetical protein AGMMS4956_14400 [Bacteroidia bacterium]
MKHYNFLRAIALVGMAGVLSWQPIAKAAAADDAAKPVDLVAVMGGEPKGMLLKALEPLGGIGNFVKKGQVVVLKPNIGWDKTPELAANANPDLVGALVALCLQAGAKEVQVFDHTCDDWNKCYNNSGIRKAVEAAGGKMLPGNDKSYYKKVDLPQGVKLKTTLIHEAILNCDVWINIPVLKHHGGAKLSCAMKNLMGIVWDRQYFHVHDLQQCIADLCSLEKKPVLNVVDAYRAMKANGPQGRNQNDVVTLKTLIVSPDIVAADAAALTFFNQIPSVNLPESEVGHIYNAHQLQLGNKNLKDLNIKRIKM